MKRCVQTWVGSRSGGMWLVCFFFSSRRRHTRLVRDWSSDVCSSDLITTSILKSREIDVGDEILEDTDWLRSGGSGSFDDDYEDMFNQDPGQN